MLSKILGISSKGNALTGGIVGSCEFSILPNVRRVFEHTIHCSLITIVSHTHFHATSLSYLCTLENIENATIPQVPAWLTNMLMFLSMMPCLVLIWKCPHPKLFLHALAYTYMCYFTFGFHVHEKAIIIVVSLLALCAVESGRDAALFLRICFIGTFCLFPLLFEIRETCTNILILLTCWTIFYILLDSCKYLYSDMITHIAARKIN